MITRKELLKNETFWTEIIQNQVYSDLVSYIKENNLSQNELAKKLGVSKGYISQVLSGENLNFRINTLVRICLAINKVPNIQFEDIEDFIDRDNKSANGEISCERYTDFSTPIFFQAESNRKNVKILQNSKQEDLSLATKVDLRILKKAI